MESGSTSYCVYTPGNTSPSRPPMRRAAPEHARSGFPFLIGMAALVLAVGIGSVARFCPQDLRLAGGGGHPAKPTTATTTPPLVTSDPLPAAPAPTVAIITTGTTSTTAHATPKKKLAHPRPHPSSSAGASAAPSSAPALPENPYPQASPPETYGF